jgi:DNA gyrase subunit A
LEGLKKALDHIDEVIAAIKKSQSPADAKEALVSKFGFSEAQAQAILDMKLQRLTGLERDKIDEEYKELKKDIARLEKILADRKILLDVIKKELLEIKGKYADKRRTVLAHKESEGFNVEDLIPDEKMVITISRKGYIKRTDLSGYRVQKRGGVGIKGGATGIDDFLEHIFIATNHSSILYFTNTGKVYRTKVYELPEGSRISKGIPIANLRLLQPSERVCAILVVSDFTLDLKVVLVTKKGSIKRVNLSDFQNVLKTGIIACSLDQGDELIASRLSPTEADIIVATKHGKAAVFSGDKVRVMGRQARGVRAIKLDKDDEVSAMDVIMDKESYVITLTELGFGKRTRAKTYPVHNRAGKGVCSTRITKKTGGLVGLRIVKDSDDIMIISSSGQIIRMPVSQIRSTGRAAQGVKTIRLKEGETIIDFTKYISEEPEGEEDTQ